MKYRNKKTGQIGEVVHFKGVTTTLKFEDNTTATLSPNMLKTYWVKLTDEEPIIEETEKTQKELKKEVKKEETSIIGTEENVKNKRKEKTIIMENQITEVQKFIEDQVGKLGGEVSNSSKTKNMHSLKVGGHMFAIMTVSSKAVSLKCRPKVINELSAPARTVNHTFGAVYQFTELNEETKNLINQLLQVSKDYQTAKEEEKNNG